MKKAVVAIVVVIIAILSLNAAGNHYRYELYDWAVGFESSQANLSKKVGEVQGRSFAYFESPKVEGQETIVMLHGFGASKENWLRFAAHLTGQYHVIALDLKGHGDNERDLNEAYAIQDQVDYVSSVTQALGLNNFHLVGNSMGGAISSLYSAMYPEQVLSAVLISPAGIHDVPSLMDKQLETGKNPLIAESIEEFEALLDFAMEAPPYIPGPIVKVEAEKAVSRVKINTHIFAQLRADLKKGMESRLQQIKAPVLIIWGDQDRAINVENIDKYARMIPKAEKLVLEDIGHLAMIEVPGVSAKAMLDFLNRN